MSTVVDLGYLVILPSVTMGECRVDRFFLAGATNGRQHVRSSGSETTLLTPLCACICALFTGKKYDTHRRRMRTAPFSDYYERLKTK